MSDLEARCRNCGNTGVDMFGKPCVCRYGKALPGLLDTIRNLRTNGTPEGIAEAIKRAGEAQLAAHVAAGGEVPPTIREMEQGMAENERDEQGQPMTAAELAKVRERHEKATRGFWYEGNRNATLHAHDEQGTYTAATVFAESFADVQALTHAWEDIAALLADATYWRGKVEQARTAVQSAQTMMDSEHMQRTERLLEQMDACWEIVRAVAAMPTDGIDPTAPYRVTVEQARAVLATVSQSAQTEAEA